jgi:hypothetical protein
MKTRAALFLSTIALAAAQSALAQGSGRLNADLIGYEEPPSLSTPATGEFDARLDRDDQEISWRLSYGGFEAGTAVTQAHIHLGQRSVNGGISVFLCTNLGNGPAGTQACPPFPATISGTIRPADVIGPTAQGIAPGEFAELVRAIRAGVTYVNVHTTRFPNGEIRDQISSGRGHGH